MTIKLSLGRLASLLAAFVIAAGAWSPADARIHSLTGDARAQIGNGLPIPIGFTAAPHGRIAATTNATLMQHGTNASTNPAKIVIDPTQFTAPGNAVNLPVFLSNPNVFQVQTAIPIQFPKNKIMFSAGGRTGAATVTFCPGNVVTANGNPACSPAGTIPGLMRYTKTTHQFGGPAQSRTLGQANVALRVAAGAPCTYGGGANPGCQVIFALATPQTMAAAGAPFGFFNQTAGAANPTGRYYATINASGKIIGITTTGLGSGLPNPATSYGGPWTTGMLTVSNTAATPAELFIMSGTDARTFGGGGYSNEGGAGTISLVSGAVSARTLSGPNANRGWLNMTIGPKISHIPVTPAYGVAALVALTALSGAYALRRRATA